MSSEAENTGTVDTSQQIGGHNPRQPDRWPVFRIHQELHARVAEPVTAPCRIRHSAYLLRDAPGAAAEVRRCFEEVARALDIPHSTIHWGERSGRVVKNLDGGGSLRVQWELHTEFYSFTTFHYSSGEPQERDGMGEPFSFPAMPFLGVKVVDLDMLVVPGLEVDTVLRTFLHSGTVYGGQVLQGDARMWTTFQVDENGQGRYLVGAGNLGPGRLGRLIRRLVEIENYYHLILMPLEDYQAHVPTLRAIEKRLAERSEDIAADLAARETDPAREHRWLVYLTRDMAELIHVTERMRYKLFAANSYYAIFEERLRWLREQTGDGYQSLEEFLTTRISPAIGNYRNFIERSEVLSSQLTSLGNMMRTRVSLNMEEQSLATMQAMNRRVELQLALQRTVEGLSLIVLSYYLTGLASYVLKAVGKYIELPGGVALWTAATIPVWLAIAWTFTHRIKALVEHHATGAPHKP